MDQLRMTELSLRHRHNEGSWSRLEPRPVHHDAAEHDPERDGPSGQLYACPTCDEQVIVDVPAYEDPHGG